MRALRWIGLIVGLLVVIAAAIAGGLWLGHESAPAPSPTVTPTPTLTTHSAGVYSWEALTPGDCVSDFTSAWQDTYTVVDCSSDHNGQLLVRAAFPDAPIEYPGAKTLSAQVTKLCAAKDIYSVDAAKAYPSLYLPGAYPMTEGEWAKSPSYECFVTAGKGHVMNSDLMPGAQSAPTTTVTPTMLPTATPAATPAT